jgi:2'-hydroxyisoflavone reductase
MSTRRAFVKQVAATVSALPCAVGLAGAQEATPSRASLRLLVLGGTGAIGPYHARAALARGHQVAVFSRGKTVTSLPQSVERLVGDRNGDLAAIANREWDVVLDIATFGPSWVRSLADKLGDRVRHYTFISTVSVYDNPRANGVTTESSRVLEYTGREDPYTVVTHVGEHYGALKVLCEREAEKRFPGRTLVLRPGYIGGPGDSRALTYWAARAEKGGELLAGGEATAPVQYIDVRDMAEWAIRLMEQRVTGTFNAVGPVAATNAGQIVDTAIATLSPRSKVTWVPASWLLSQPNPELWGTLLFWSHGVGDIMRMSNERAVASGLVTRPIGDTLHDALAWYKGQAPEKRATLITGFKRQPDGTWAAATSPWSEYLAREREVLARWKATPARDAAP